MNDGAPIEQRHAPRRAMSWTKMSLVVTIILTFVVALVLLFWSQATTSSYVADKVRHFAAAMKAVRPIMLFVALMLWRPIFSWLHSRSFITDPTHAKAIGGWPRLVAWVALIELTIGQGFVVIGLIATTLYWFFMRLR